MCLSQTPVTSVLLIALLSAGCPRTSTQLPSQPPPTPIGSVREEPPTQLPLVNTGRSKDAPEIWLNVSVSEGDKIYRGWPLLVGVEVGYPEGMIAAQEGRPSKPLSIIPSSGGWDTLVTVNFHDATQKKLTLPLVQAVRKPEGMLVLGDSGGVLRWYVGPDETRKLELGNYQGFAILESSTGADQGGWTGRAGSSTVTFDVVDEPVPLSDELAEEKAVQFAQYEIARGAPAAALAHLDAHLAAAPDSPSALLFKAQLKEEAGSLQEALQLYEAALDVTLRKHPDAQEPPFLLVDHINALHEKLGH